MAVYKQVDVVDTSSETLAEDRGAVNGSMVTLGIVVLVVAALLIGYFAWYAPSQNAAPAVIEHNTTTTTNTTTPVPVPAANPPVIVNNPAPAVNPPANPPVIVNNPPPAAASPSTNTNTSGNGTGAGSPDNGGG